MTETATQPHAYDADDYGFCSNCGRVWVADVHTNRPGESRKLDVGCPGVYENPREVMNWGLRKAMDELDQGCNQDAESGESADPETVLQRMHSARGYLTDVEKWAVAEMRADGISWRQIGNALGVTAQAAQQRFG